MQSIERKQTSEKHCSRVVVIDRDSVLREPLIQRVDIDKHATDRCCLLSDHGVVLIDGRLHSRNFSGVEKPGIRKRSRSLSLLNRWDEKVDPTLRIWLGESRSIYLAIAFSAPRNSARSARTTHLTSNTRTTSSTPTMDAAI